MASIYRQHGGQGIYQQQPMYARLRVCSIFLACGERARHPRMWLCGQCKNSHVPSIVRTGNATPPHGHHIVKRMHGSIFKSVEMPLAWDMVPEEGIACRQAQMLYEQLELIRIDVAIAIHIHIAEHVPNLLIG